MCSNAEVFEEVNRKKIYIFKKNLVPMSNIHCLGDLVGAPAVLYICASATLICCRTLSHTKMLCVT